MTLDSELQHIGRDLVAHAESKAPFSAQRGLVEGLFPSFYKARRRMSTRAISRWLWEVKKVKLSSESIAKALRNPEKYWERFYESVAWAAGTFEVAHRMWRQEFLYDRKLFDRLKAANDKCEGPRDGLWEATAALEEDWFGADEGMRKAVWEGNHWRRVKESERIENLVKGCEKKEMGNARGKRSRK